MRDRFPPRSPGRVGWGTNRSHRLATSPSLTLPNMWGGD
jgi:hypothetical protein